MPEGFEVEAIRLAILGGIALVLLVVDALFERRLNKSFAEGTPASISWTVRITILAVFGMCVPSVLGWKPPGQVLSAFHTGMSTTLLDMGESRVTAWGLVIFCVGIALTFGASRVARSALRRSAALKRVADEGTVGVFDRLLHYAVLAIGFSVALNIAGVNLAAFFAAGAVFAVGIGFAMQNIAQNFVSGVIILVERAIKPGDILEIDGQMVRVQRMGIRSTIVRTLYDEDVIVPNSTLAQNAVKNFTLLDNRLRISAQVGVSYDSDVKLVFETLERVGADFPGRVPDKPAVVLLDGFGSSSVDFDISVWITDPWRRRTATSQLRDRIWWALKEQHVVIAFPQLDLHLDPQVESSLVKVG